MKHYALLLLLFVAVACAHPAPITDTLQPASVPSDRGTADGSAMDQSFNTPCAAPADPKVMLAAFPATYGSYVQSGTTSADRSDLPMPDGSTTKQSVALRTLTLNDETYISFVATDACGFNTNLAEYQLYQPIDDDSTHIVKTTVKGYDGWQIDQKNNGGREIVILLKHRLLVKIDGDTATDVTAAANQVDITSIEAAMGS